MDNKDFVNLLLKEIKEMSLLCESLSKIEEIPFPLLSLSKEKVDSMSSILNELMNQNSSKSACDTVLEKERDSDPVPSVEVEEDSSKCELELGEEDQKSKKSKKELEKEEVPDFGIVLVQDDVESQGEAETSCLEASEEVVKQEKKKEVSARIPVRNASAESRFVKSLKLCLGDKFRYKKELFGDDMDLLNQTMKELDQLHSLEEAFAYIERFDWSEENPAVEDFLNLLQSRFS